MEIKNLDFDIGGVLADYRLKEFLADKGFSATMIKRILKVSIMSPYWEQFERGDITEEEALAGFTSLDPEIGKELSMAFSSVTGMLTIREYAIPLVKNLKSAGFHLYNLSNYSKKAYIECGESLAFMPYMDGGLVSFQTRKTKPDPEMFIQLLKAYKLALAECVFIDDTPENVTSARMLGFIGIEFTTCDRLIAELNELGVECQYIMKEDQ